MENYRSLEAHVVFVSGWVQTVYHLKSRSGIMVLKADVKPSYRVTEEPHHPWVALKKGWTSAAHCDCMAGLKETCSHIGALLFKMEAAVRLGYTLSACTDVPCVWNQCFVKNVKPAPVANIKFYSAKAKQKLTKTKRTPRPLATHSSDIEQSDFFKCSEVS